MDAERFSSPPISHCMWLFGHCVALRVASSRRPRRDTPPVWMFCIRILTRRRQSYQHHRLYKVFDKRAQMHASARACARVLSNVLNTRKHFRPRRARWPSELPPPTPRSAVAGSPIAAHRKFIQLNTHYKPDPLSGNAAATRTCLAAPVRVRSAQVIARRCALRERIARFVGC